MCAILVALDPPDFLLRRGSNRLVYYYQHLSTDLVFLRRSCLSSFPVLGQQFSNHDCWLAMIPLPLLSSFCSTPAINRHSDTLGRLACASPSAHLCQHAPKLFCLYCFKRKHLMLVALGQPSPCLPSTVLPYCGDCHRRMVAPPFPTSMSIGIMFTLVFSSPLINVLFVSCTTGLHHGARGGPPRRAQEAQR